MRKVSIIILTIATVLLSASCTRQEQEPASSKLTNLKDSASYAMGIIIAQQYIEDNSDTLMNLNQEFTVNAINDLLINDTSILSHEEAIDAINNYMRQVLDARYSNVKKAGEDFLMQNLEKTGIVPTRNGMQYEVIKEGNSNEHPSVSDNVVIKLIGTKIDGSVFINSNGQEFETSFRSMPSGLIDGIMLMTPGAKYRFYLPYTLAYGESGYQTVEPYSTVIFDVELIEIVKK